MAVIGYVIDEQLEVDISDYQSLAPGPRARPSRKQLHQVIKTAFEYSGELASGISVKESPIDGFGCFADTFFSRHGIVAEYRGERITNQEAIVRMKLIAKPQISQIDDQWSIDGSVGGNGTQFLNHSCDPNSSVQILDDRILVIAERNISPGEEITVDYLNSYESDQSSCNCRSVNCRK